MTATVRRAAAAAVLLAALLAGATASTPERTSEWKMLFDGRSLDGWRVFTPGAKEGDATFSAADGVLSCTGSPAGYIATTDEFESFELELEWRFDPEKGPGNSGVLLRVDAKDAVWPRSIEAQLHSGNAGDIWNIGEVPMRAEASRTEGRRTRKAHESSEKPIGEWNRYRIRLDGGTLELHVNGKLQNAAEACEVRKGRIALQSEGAFIQFRDIRIRPLRSESEPAGAPGPTQTPKAPTTEQPAPNAPPKRPTGAVR